MATDSSVSSNRAERVLAYMVAATVGLSILAFLAVIIGTAAGVQREEFGEGIWPVVVMLPWIGLPLGILLLVALLITSSVRRMRASKES